MSYNILFQMFRLNPIQKENQLVLRIWWQIKWNNSLKA